MNGVVPLLAGIGLVVAGGIAMSRTAGGRVSERRQLEARLQELRLRDDPGDADGAGPSLPRDLPKWLGIMFARADIVPRVEPVLMGGAFLAVAVGIVMLLWGWIAAAVLAVASVGGAALVLRTIAHRRITLFIADLPTFLDTMRQMLTTGSSVQQAFTRSAENAGPEMQRYLLPMVRRLQNGAAVGESAVWLAERLDVLELHMFATAIQTNIRYGGRLSMILSNLIAVLRDRSRVIRELKAATAETRMSGIVLACLPVAAGLFIMVSNASYMQFFIRTEQGNHLLLLAIFLQLFGVLVMRMLMRLDY